MLPAHSPLGENSLERLNVDLAACSRRLRPSRNSQLEVVQLLTHPPCFSFWEGRKRARERVSGEGGVPRPRCWPWQRFAAP